MDGVLIIDKELGLTSAPAAPQAPAKDEPDPEDKEDDRAAA